MTDNIVRRDWQNPRPQPELNEFAPFSPSEQWNNKVAPPLQWMVDGAFIRGTVGILAGDGGLGKSLLLQQMMTAMALGVPWLGMPTVKTRTLAMFCEDDADELHRRQESINAHYGCRMSDLDAMRIESRPGRDSVLMQFKQWGGDGQMTPMMSQLYHAAETHGAQAVILDTVADVFSGNEVDRNQPRTFIRALRRLALKLQGVVVLTQHPSNEGMSSGSGRSGSTGWHNSVRSRLYLTKPKGEELKESDDRWLKTMKQNSGKFGGHTVIRWQRGVFVTHQEVPAAKNYYSDRDWQE
jgi:RecA-family ATPase